MSKVLLACAQPGSDLNTASQTNYFSFGCGQFSTGQTTEAETLQTLRQSCTIANFGVRVESNTRTSSTVWTVRKNGADTALTFTVPSTTTGYVSDTSHSISYSSGDQLSASVVTGADASHSLTFGPITVTMDSSGATIDQYMSFGSRIFVDSVYYPFFGNMTSGGLIPARSTMLVAGTASRLFVRVGTNTAGLSTTFVSQINGVTGNQTITVPAGTTGDFEDTTHTDTMAVGDTVSCFCTCPSGSATGTVTACGFKFTNTTDDGSHTLLSNSLNGRVFDPSVDYTSIAAGQSLIPSAVTLPKARFTGLSGPKLSKLFGYINNNTSVTDTYLKTIINGSAGTVVAVILAGVTGSVQDTTHTDSVLSTDDLELSTGGQSGGGALVRVYGVSILVTQVIPTPFTQTNWYTPGPAYRGTALAAQTNGAPGQENLLIGADKLPFRQLDWPNPTLALSRMQSMLAQALGAPRNNNLLVGQDTFYGAAGEVIAYTWPVPAGPPARHVAIAAQTNGLAPALFNVAISPLFVEEWVNPRGYVQPIQTQPQGSPLNLTLLPGQDALPFRQLDWPNPVLPLSRLVARIATAEGTAENLTLLSGQDQLPRNQFDWPNPRGPLQPIQTQPYGTALILTTLVGKDILPLNQDDWPNPVLPISRTAALLAQPLGVPVVLNLYPGQDALPFRQLDWPNPVLPVSRLVAVTAQPLGQNPEEEATEVPLSQDDWPNPVLPLSRTVALVAQPVGTPTLLTLLPGQDKLPFVQTDWPNPVLPIDRRAAVNAQVLGCPGNLFLLLIQPGIPKNQFDWPNPTLPLSRGVALSAQPLGILETLYARFYSPFNQFDWPNPVLPVSRTAALVAQPQGTPLVLTTLAGQDQLPKNQTDWPNPVLPLSRMQARTSQAEGTAENLTLYPGKDFLPFRQTEWPNPVLPISRLAAGVAQPQGSPLNVTTLLGADVLPLRIHWTNPVWPVSRGVAITSQPLGQQQTEEQVEQRPFNQTNWPLPVRAEYRFGASSAQPIGSPLVLTTLLGQDRLPFNQDDWPNPVLPLPRFVAVTAQPLGQTQEEEAVETVPFNQFDWPNPVLPLSRFTALVANPPSRVPPTGFIPIISRPALKGTKVIPQLRADVT